MKYPSKEKSPLMTNWGAHHKRKGAVFNKVGKYFNQFFNETYYYQSMVEIKESIPVFFSELFEYKTVDTQINLQMIVEIYKNLYKSLQKTNKPNF